MGLISEISVVLVLIGIVYWWSAKNIKNRLKHIPGPPKLMVFGNALDFTSGESIIPTIQRYMKDHGETVDVQMGPLRHIIATQDYDLIQFFLSSNKIIEKSLDYKFLKNWLGLGLLLSTGELWKKQRKILTPAFHFQILERFVDDFHVPVDVLIKKLEKQIDKDSVDIYPFISLAALDIICASTMGTQLNAQDDEESEYVFSVREMCRILRERTFSAFKQYHASYRFTKDYYKEERVLKVLHDYSNKVIRSRRKQLEQQKKSENDISNSKKRAFLDVLIEARDVDGNPMPDAEIRQQVDTFMFAGHDTTSSAISFTLYSLAKHPDIQQKVYEELKNVLQSSKTDVISYNSLTKMTYLEQVIKESLRLYPPVVLVGRALTEDVEYDGTIFPKDATIAFFSYGIHHSEKYYPNPEVFDPSRFENTENTRPFMFIPFSAGPRNCIGQKYAMLEMKYVISKILKNFELCQSVSEHKLRLTFEIILKSNGGIKIQLKKRRN